MPDWPALLKVLACGISAVYVMVYTITPITLQEQLLTLFHKFLLFGMVIFAELGDVLGLFSIMKDKWQ